jgi:hypothetical protein
VSTGGTKHRLAAAQGTRRRELDHSIDRGAVTVPKKVREHARGCIDVAQVSQLASEPRRRGLGRRQRGAPGDYEARHAVKVLAAHTPGVDVSLGVCLLQQQPHHKQGCSFCEKGVTVSSAAGGGAVSGR